MRFQQVHNLELIVHVNRFKKDFGASGTGI